MSTLDKPATPSLDVKSDGKGARPEAKPDNFRDTVESIVLAFILAFLFRTFVAEAFVIPTGSMGPTLRGRHKDLACPQCGHRFLISNSERQGNPSQRIAEGMCPVCRYWFPVDRYAELDQDVQGEVASAPMDDGDPHYSYNGDRILVNKFSYMFQEPKRWDVIVFKYPIKPQVNYIKRLVGLPGETLYLSQGDVFVQRGEQAEFTIANKPHAKQLAMMQMVFDNDRQGKLTEMQDAGFPPRWRGGRYNASGEWEADEGEAQSGWSSGDGFVTFHREAPPAAEEASDWSWLRYRHLTPMRSDWDNIKHKQKLAPGREVKPHLITDLSCYDTGSAVENIAVDDYWHMQGMHWVGDLVLQCELETSGASGQVMLELNEGPRRFRCLFNLADGQAALQMIAAGGEPETIATAKTRVQGAGVHQLRLANCDDQLLVWVDESPVEFDKPTTFRSRNWNEHITPTSGDLAPAGVAVKGAAATVRRLKLYRDIYYIAPNGGISEFSGAGAFGNETPLFQLNSFERMNDVFSNPAMFARYAEELSPGLRFPLENDQFFAMGDNSAHSQDSRYWRDRWGNEHHYVERDLLIGKAFFIYWPHGWETPWHVQTPLKDIRVPFYPDVTRMRRIR